MVTYQLTEYQNHLHELNYVVCFLELNKAKMKNQDIRVDKSKLERKNNGIDADKHFTGWAKLLRYFQAMI